MMPETISQDFIHVVMETMLVINVQALGELAVVVPRVQLFPLPAIRISDVPIPDPHF